VEREDRAGAGVTRGGGGGDGVALAFWGFVGRCRVLVCGREEGCGVRGEKP
jgi:hypothetical protein